MKVINMKLMDVYRSILQAFGVTITGDDMLSIGEKDNLKPLMVKHKRLVLPTREHLTNPDRESRIIFHPMSESLQRDMSDVLDKFRGCGNTHLNQKFSMIFLRLLVLGTSPAEHKKLSPDQSAFLPKVKNADEKTVQTFITMLDKIPAAQMSKLFVNIFLKRPGIINGRTYPRAGIVSFPFYQELKNLKKDEDFHGVKLRVKDREALLGLLEFLIPNIDDPTHYHRGSDSTVAPWLDALMRTFQAVASPMNDMIALFGDLVDEEPFNDDWFEAFENLEQFQKEIRLIPMQAGNEGAIPGQPVAPEPAAVPVATEPARRGNTMAELFPQQQQQPMYPPQYMQQQYQQPQQQPQGNYDPSNFADVLRNNPNLARAAGVGMQHPNQFGGMMQPRIPGRASPSNPYGSGALNNVGTGTGVFTGGGMPNRGGYGF